MVTLEDLGEVISTDVLIVGGGIGGLATAIKIKEENPEADVLIVEKQTTGWAGKATKIGGILAFLGPDDDADKFLDFQVRTSGFYLNDQELSKETHIIQYGMFLMKTLQYSNLLIEIISRMQFLLKYLQMMKMVHTQEYLIIQEWQIR